MSEEEEFVFDEDAALDTPLKMMPFANAPKPPTQPSKKVDTDVPSSRDDGINSSMDLAGAALVIATQKMGLASDDAGQEPEDGDDHKKRGLSLFSKNSKGDTIAQQPLISKREKASAPVAQTMQPGYLHKTVSTSRTSGAESIIMQNVDIETLRHKVLFIGDTGVGKSSIIRRIDQNSFEDHASATIGIDFAVTAITINGMTFRVQIIDTSGQERFQTLVSGYVPGSAVFVVVFDLTNRLSFESVSKWMVEIKKYVSKPKIFLVGNKSDMEAQVTYKEATRLAADHNVVSFCETSAKVGVGVQTLFDAVVKEIPGVAEKLQQVAIDSDDDNGKNREARANDRDSDDEAESALEFSAPDEEDEEKGDTWVSAFTHACCLPCCNR